MRTAKRARFGVVIYTERDWTRGFSAFVFFVLFSLLSVFFFSRECFFVSYSFYRRTHRRRQRRCYDYFESSIITFPSWPRTNITTTGIFRYLQTNIRYHLFSYKRLPSPLKKWENPKQNSKFKRSTSHDPLQKSPEIASDTHSHTRRERENKRAHR